MLSRLEHDEIRVSGNGMGKSTSPIGRDRAEGAGEGYGPSLEQHPSPDLLRKSTSPRWGEVD